MLIVSPCTTSAQPSAELFTRPFQAYAMVGTVAYSSLCAVSEMTSVCCLVISFFGQLLTGGGACQFAPISGSFPHFAGRFFDRALGFAVGWNYM